MVDIRRHTTFLHCPRCASAELVSHEGKAMKCPACGFLYFHNCASSVAGILEYNGKIILGRRACEPRKGLLDLPGGFVDYRESLEDALVREVEEELHLTLQQLAYFSSSHDEYEYGGVNYFCNVAVFRSQIPSLDGVCAGDDLSDFELFKPSEIPLDQIAFQCVREILQRYIASGTD